MTILFSRSKTKIQVFIPNLKVISWRLTKTANIYIIYYSLKNKKKQPKQLMNGRKIDKIL